MLYPSELQARSWFRKEAELGCRNDSIADWLWALGRAERGNSQERTLISCRYRWALRSFGYPRR